MTALSGAVSAFSLDAGGDLYLGIHISPQQPVGVRQFDPDARRSRLHIEMRINQRDLPLEGSIWVSPWSHVDLLSRRNQGDVPLGDVSQHPDQGMIDDAKQHVPRRGAHAVNRRPLQDMAVLRRGPCNHTWNAAGAPDHGDGAFVEAEIDEPPLGSLQTLGVDPAATPHVEDGDIFGGCARKIRPIHAHQRLALANVIALRKLPDRFDEAFEAQGDDRDTARVELDPARRSNWDVQRPTLDGFGANASLLQLSGADRDGRAVLRLVLVDRYVIHSHRVLLGNGRCVRQTHGVAVEAHASLAASLGGACEAGLSSKLTSSLARTADNPCRRCLSWASRNRRATVGVTVINDRACRRRRLARDVRPGIARVPVGVTHLKRPSTSQARLAATTTKPKRITM